VGIATVSASYRKPVMMDVVCDERDPAFWRIVLSVCEQAPGQIVRLSVCRVLRPRGDTIQLYRAPSGNRSGPVGLVISSEATGERECVTVAVFRRRELLEYARMRLTVDLA